MLETHEEQETVRQCLAWALEWLDNVERQASNDALLDAKPYACPSRDLMRRALAGDTLPVATRSAREAVTVEVLPDGRGVKVWGFAMEDGSTLIPMADVRATSAALAAVLAGDPDPGEV